MLQDLAASVEIASLTQRLLREADAEGRLPTPVDDIIAAADLVEPKQSLLSESSIAEAPQHLRKAMRKVRSKVHAVLDRRAREIHIHPDIQIDGQRRFKQLHEVTHKILPWQDELAYADDYATLSWTTQKEFEREANQGGAELLFQRDHFALLASEYETSFAAIVELSEKFGASIHASFRRYVETHRKPLAGLVLGKTACQVEPTGYRRREALNSAAWAERYELVSCWPNVLRSTPYAFIGELPSLVSGVATPYTFTYPDVNNQMTELHVEAFSNSYNLFVLLWPPRTERFKRRRLLAPSATEA